ncbi:MAG: FGGY family carbohydrate kinase [Kiritimatiellae bacterium]|nr:FGGY family carbohydrate kinase [Kiritimatiellia bacterium]
MSCAIGIDIGTGKAAVVAIDTGGALRDSASVKTKADIPVPEGRSEQNAAAILEAVGRAVKSIDPEIRRRISAVGITGQMHGMILWNDEEASPLYTWKDKRTLEGGFLDKIRRKPGCRKLRAGFGSATLAYLAARNELGRWSSAGTIHDYFACKICALAKPLTDPSDAASWGLFDIRKKQWNFAAIGKLKIPAKFFPKVVPAGAQAGRLSGEYSSLFGLPEGIPVHAPIGDNQASILATANNTDEEIYLTLGTGGQLSVVIPEKMINEIKRCATVEVRPFVGQKYIAVAAPLCGGQAFEWLINSLQTWLKELGISPPGQDEFYRIIDILGLKSNGDSLAIKPNFLGERDDFSLRGEISGITLGNFSLGNISAALARGVIANIQRMMPDEIFRDKKTVVCSGNAIRRLKILQEAVKTRFHLPIRILPKSEEAALGAARVAMPPS